MSSTEIKAKIFDLQEENKKLKEEKEKLKKHLKEKLFSLSEDYFLSVEFSNATAIKELSNAYENILKKIINNNEQIEKLREKLTLMEE